MFPYSKSINPAVRTHLDSQAAYFNDLSGMMSNSFQQIFQANLQLGQTMLEEILGAGQRMFTTENGTDAFGAAAARAQPASNKLRAYQQHLSRLTADAQVEFARVNERHAPKTAQTAQSLMEEVQRDAVEQTDRNLRQQQEALHQFRDPFQREASAGEDKSADRTGANMQSDTPARQSGQPAQQTGNKAQGKGPD